MSNTILYGMQGIPHKHCAHIIAWAKGALVRRMVGYGWVYDLHPTWDVHENYDSSVAYVDGEPVYRHSILRTKYNSTLHVMGFDGDALYGYDSRGAQCCEQLHELSWPI